MRLAIDGIPLLLRSAGVKTYIYHWVQHLRRLAGEENVVAFPYIGKLDNFSHEESVLGVPQTVVRLAFLHTINYSGLPLLDWVGPRVDVFHASHLLRNPPRVTRLTTTLHDMTCWVVPETHTPRNVAAVRRFGELVMRRADGLIAVSESTRSDAVRILGLSEEKIEVIYSGIAEPYFQTSPEIARVVAAKHGLSRPYLLCVGTVEPRKNVDMLLDAYSQLRPSLRDEFDLVVAGPVGWASTRTVQHLRSGGAGVRYLGYVAEEDLPGLTAGATIFVYPSLYEGFGFPVAQAMAAGVPVICSNASSLPEVAGDAAVLIDPRSVAELRGAIERLLLSPSLRSELAASGANRAQRYTWESCARASLAFFEKTCGS
jgi:alpha-1,3-rhamnosyl/mannosyltransferase